MKVRSREGSLGAVMWMGWGTVEAVAGVVDKVKLEVEVGLGTAIGRKAGQERTEGGGKAEIRKGRGLGQHCCFYCWLGRHWNGETGGAAG